MLHKMLLLVQCMEHQAVHPAKKKGGVVPFRRLNSYKQGLMVEDTHNYNLFFYKATGFQPLHTELELLITNFSPSDCQENVSYVLWVFPPLNTKEERDFYYSITLIKNDVYSKIQQQKFLLRQAHLRASQNMIWYDKSLRD